MGPDELTLTKKLRNWAKLHSRNCLDTARDLCSKPVGTLLTVAVIGIALALPAALNVLVKNGQGLAGGWESARDFSVYLKPGTELAQAEVLATDLLKLAGIAEVDLTSADTALEQFRINSGFGDALDMLDSNPLPHTLSIRPNEDMALATLAALAEEIALRPAVDIVQVDTIWVERLNAILEFMRRIVIVAATLLVIGVIIIIGNTIRLDIQNRRDEIETLKLLGASDGFVRRPFLYVGLWYGAAGSVMALVLLLLGSWILASPVERLIGLYASDMALLGIDAATAFAVLCCGVLAGWGGAWSTVARHLAAIQPK